MFGQTLQGPGFELALPPGFVLLGQPQPYNFMMLPPGSDPYSVPSILSVRPVYAHEAPGLLSNFYNLHDPMVAMANAANLGLVQVTGMGPPRQQPMIGAVLHIRELDGITVRGIPARVMIVLVQSQLAMVEVLCFVNLFRWTEFMGACLQLLAGLRIAGAGALATGVQAVVDPQHKDQIEYQLVGPNNQTTPITALPTSVGGNVVINVEKLVINDNTITAGNIHGTGIVLGHHSTAKVS